MQNDELTSIYSSPSPSVLSSCIQPAQSSQYSTAQGTSLVSTMARTIFSFFFSVVLVLQAVLPSVSAFCLWDCDKPRAPQLDIKLPVPDNHVMQGRLVLYQNITGGGTTPVGCINEDARVAHFTSPACNQKSTYAVYPTQQGVVLLTRERPQKICGISNSLFTCSQNVAAWNSLVRNTGQIPILNRQIRELRSPVQINFGGARSNYWEISSNFATKGSTAFIRLGEARDGDQESFIKWIPAK